MKWPLHTLPIRHRLDGARHAMEDAIAIEPTGWRRLRRLDKKSFTQAPVSFTNQETTP